MKRNKFGKYDCDVCEREFEAGKLLHICGECNDRIEATQEPHVLPSNSSELLCVCFNSKCPNNDESESGCATHSKHTVDLCNAFVSKTAAERIAELVKALDELTDVCAECDSWESFPSGPLEKAITALNT